MTFEIPAHLESETPEELRYFLELPDEEFEDWLYDLPSFEKGSIVHPFDLIKKYAIKVSADGNCDQQRFNLCSIFVYFKDYTDEGGVINSDETFHEFFLKYEKLASSLGHIRKVSKETSKSIFLAQRSFNLPPAKGFA